MKICPACNAQCLDETLTCLCGHALRRPDDTEFTITRPSGPLYFPSAEGIRDAFKAGHISEAAIVHVEAGNQSENLRDFLINRGFAGALEEVRSARLALSPSGGSRLKRIAGALVSNIVIGTFLMTLAGLCSLGLTGDPGHPSMLAVFAAFAALGSVSLCLARYFGKAGSLGLVLGWIFVAFTGVFAFASAAGVVAFSAHSAISGIACLLGFCGVIKLHDSERPLSSYLK